MLNKLIRKTMKMKLRYFTLEEFDSPDAPGSGKEKMSVEFLKKLDEARHIAGIPFKINSGYRTPEHNKKVGGVKDSSHVQGTAADISCVTSAERFIIITALIKAGFNRIGVGNTFIHVDNDFNKVPELIWTY